MLKLNEFFGNWAASVATCSHCASSTIWLGEDLLYPSLAIGEVAHADMPESVRSDYNEARKIASSSPRGAAALLRLAIQKLCKALGEKGSNLNEDIKSLVARGLKPTVQQALDIVRVVGNNAVHPGQMDLNDNIAMVNSLFSLINLIVDEMIAEPKRIEEIFGSLPDGARQQIKIRDDQSEAVSRQTSSQ